MHRIIVTTSSIGRVAFVRQLVNTELVVTYPDDYNDDDSVVTTDVTTELVRFGFRTLIYPNNTTTAANNNGYSALGNFLIPWTYYVEDRGKTYVCESEVWVREKKGGGTEEDWRAEKEMECEGSPHCMNI